MKNFIVSYFRSPMKERAESTTRPLGKDFFEEENIIETSSKFKSTLSLEESAFDSGLRFCLPKQQKKNAETLLQQMFESELMEDDLGPKGVEDLDDLDDIAEEQELRREKRLEFETVDG
jgi:signal recognition particle GTPase